MPTVRSCEIVSRLKNDEGEVIFDLEKLPQILKEKDNILREYAYIIIWIYIPKLTRVKIQSIKQEH